MTLSIALVLSIFMIMASLIWVQSNHYQFLKSQQEMKSISLLSSELEEKLKEFEEYKKRVDSLTIKSGFKL